MASSRTSFYLDKTNSKWLGVCAGAADYTGFDVTAIRITTVVLTFMTFPMFLFVYLIAAWIAPVKPLGLYEGPEDAQFWRTVRKSASGSTRDVRAKFRDLDRRLADVETFYTSRNSSLANEIDALR